MIAHKIQCKSSLSSSNDSERKSHRKSHKVTKQQEQMVLLVMQKIRVLLITIYCIHVHKQGILVFFFLACRSNLYPMVNAHLILHSTWKYHSIFLNILSSNLQHSLIHEWWPINENARKAHWEITEGNLYLFIGTHQIVHHSMFQNAVVEPAYADQRLGHEP